MASKQKTHSVTCLWCSIVVLATVVILLFLLVNTSHLIESLGAKDGFLPRYYAMPNGQPDTEETKQPERYLWLLDGKEGIASWRHTLAELVLLSRDLDRILVEPCVRHGQLVTCCPGEVYDLNSDVDKRGVAAYLSHPINATFPLSAYIDLGPLQAITRIIKFDDFIQSMPEIKDVRPWIMIGGDNVTQTNKVAELAHRFGHDQPDGPKPWPKKICDKIFISDVVFPNLDLSSFEPRSSLALQHWAKVTANQKCLTLHHYYRDRLRFLPKLREEALNMVANGTVRFQPRVLLLAAHAAKLLELRQPYLAFQWRTESVKPSHLIGCAEVAVKEIECQRRRHGLDETLLVADLPVGGTDRRMWTMYKQSTAVPSDVMVTLTREAKVKKIDGAIQLADMGLQSIVDLIFAQNAAHIVTCLESQCDFCARSASRFSRFILDLRGSENGSHDENWTCNGPMELGDLILNANVAHP